jgi:hypothetical protein
LNFELAFINSSGKRKINNPIEIGDKKANTKANFNLYNPINNPIIDRINTKVNFNGSFEENIFLGIKRIEKRTKKEFN